MINWVAVVGVTVEVGKLVLNVHVPVNALLFDNTFDNVVYVESAYDFVISWFDDVGFNVDVGRFELKVLVPVHTLLFDSTADNDVNVEIVE